MRLKGIVWTKESELDIDNIYEYYADISINLAIKIISEIVSETEKLIFTEQYQVDDINPNFRRIVVSNYKVLYEVNENEIIIYAVFDSRRDSKILKKLKT